MTAATVTVILDRIHAINQTISGYHTRRYFPAAIQSGNTPLLVPIFGQNTRTSPHTNEKLNTRDYLIMGFAGDFLQGLPTESAQKIAEAMVTDVLAMYDPRNRLQLNDNGLDFVDKADLRADSGLTPFEYGGITLALVTFTLTVVSEVNVTLL